MDTLIYHIDVNSAFLSWEAKNRYNIHKKRLNDDGYHSESYQDIRTIPAVIGGDEEMRHGIVLAKSDSAKKYGIVTGEPLADARKKCPGILVVPPNFDIYAQNSKSFIELLKKYAPYVEQFSIDEAFCDMTGTQKLYGDLTDFAYTLKDIIKNELGFTVNIGISVNKLLAKMASDFKKPDMVHTLFPDEIKDKLWPLPVRNLFFVGRQTALKLSDLGIHTIGDLASMDKNLLIYHFKKHGELIWNYANGIDTDSIIKKDNETKSYGNSQTLAFDVTDERTAKKFLLSLCESVGARIRADKSYVSTVTVNITDYEFNNMSHQMSLPSPTNVTERIYDCACTLFEQCWNHSPIRLIGVSAGKVTNTGFIQYDMFDSEKYEKLSKLNAAIDSIRNKYGNEAVTRASLARNALPDNDAFKKSKHIKNI